MKKLTLKEFLSMNVIGREIDWIEYSRYRGPIKYIAAGKGFIGFVCEWIARLQTNDEWTYHKGEKVGFYINPDCIDFYLNDDGSIIISVLYTFIRSGVIRLKADRLDTSKIKNFPKSKNLKAKGGKK